MTFRQYIDNPMGKKNAVFTQKDIYKSEYTKRFDAVYLREAGKLQYVLYRDRRTDHFYAHIKIPSEVIPKFYYDVVIRFETKDNGLRASNSLKDYDVRFFSNDPRFVFTFEYVFHKNDMFIEELKPKASKRALREFPKEKNRFGIPGYVKSIYFAWLFMNRNNLFSKYIYDQVGQPYNLRQLLDSIEDTDQKIEDRQEAGIEQQKKESKAKRAERDREISAAKAQQGNLNRLSNDDTHRVKITDKVKTVKPVSSVKKINTKPRGFRK